MPVGAEAVAASAAIPAAGTFASAAIIDIARTAAVSDHSIAGVASVRGLHSQPLGSTAMQPAVATAQQEAMLYDVHWQAEHALALGPEQRRSRVRPVTWQLLNSTGKAIALKSKGALPLASACLMDLQLLQKRQLPDSQAVVGARLAIQKAVQTSAGSSHCNHSQGSARASVAAALIRGAASEESKQTCEVAQVDTAEVPRRAARERYGDAFGAASAAGLRLLPQLQQAQRQKRALGLASHRLRGTAVVSGGLGGESITGFQQSSTTCMTGHET